MADKEAIHLAEAFGGLARTLLAASGTEQVLRRVVDLAAQTLEGCEHAGITIVDQGRIRSAAVTGEVPRTIDLLQDELRQGPCYDAIREQGTYRTGDLASEARWPRFARRAHEETGVRSVLAVRLFADAHTLGALNLYATAEDAFHDDDEAVAAVFAAHAAVAIANEREIEHLRAAAEARDVIGRAKGILMVREHVTDEQAFAMLRRASQHLNLKLRAIAEQVAETGETPSEALP